MLKAVVPNRGAIYNIQGAAS